MKKFIIGKTAASMVALRQIKTGSDKIDFMAYMLPQKVEDGKLYNCRGNCIGSWDAEDQELFPVERVLEASRFTDALLNEVLTPINKLFGSASEQELLINADDPLEDENEIDDDVEEAEVVDDEPKKKGKKGKKDPEPEPEEDEAPDAVDTVDAIKEAIKGGEFKEAKKMLKALGEDHPKYAKLKKKLKEAKNG